MAIKIKKITSQHQWLKGFYESSLFMACQTSEHANVKLLNNHRSYEKWVINAYNHHDEFKIDACGIYLNSLKYYIYFNSKRAINTYNRYSYLKNQQLKFYRITSIILKMAQRTTAGLMFKFFNDTQINPIISAKYEKPL